MANILTQETVSEEEAENYASLNLPYLLTDQIDSESGFRIRTYNIVGVRVVIASEGTK